MSSIRAPEPLTPDHDLSRFGCGVPELDHWLRRRAAKNQESGASRTYVACEESRVVAYYSLAAGAVTLALATGKVRRNMPEPIAVMVLGRLAVEIPHQGRGLGRALLRDAVLRTLQAADLAGIRAILVHAISEKAKEFYVENGFAPSPIEPLTLILMVADARAVLGR